MDLARATNLAELFRFRTLVSPDKTAITFGELNLTWIELYRRGYALSLRLREMGLQKDQIVGVYCPHSPAQVVAMLAIAMGEGVFCIINPQLKPGQIKHQLSDANMFALIADGDLMDAAFQALVRTQTEHIELIGPQGDVQGADGLQPDLNQPLSRCISADVSNIIYTSGSTGNPKGVVVPHRTLLDGARIVSGYLKINADDVTLSMLPFGFDYGLNQLMTTIYVGARLVIHRYVLPRDLLRLLEREGITGMAAVPPIWPNVFFAGKRSKKELTFPRLRYVTTAGGFHSPELLDELDRFFPTTEIIVMYGLTESFRSTYLPHAEMRNRPGSIGRPVPGVEILALNAEGKLCAPGERGELIHRGVFVTYGYLNAPELTAKKFIELETRPGCRKEIAVRSGDEVSLDEDGFIYFHGRMDQQIKTAGYRVSPDEVASAILTMPGVNQVAVLGMPHKVMGQQIAVALESDEALTLRDVTRFLGPLLPSYSMPRLFARYDALPLTANGKLDYSTLRTSFQNGSPSGVSGARTNA